MMWGPNRRGRAIRYARADIFAGGFGGEQVLATMGATEALALAAPRFSAGASLPGRDTGFVVRVVALPLVSLGFRLAVLVLNEVAINLAARAPISPPLSVVSIITVRGFR